MNDDEAGGEGGSGGRAGVLRGHGGAIPTLRRCRTTEEASGT